jgi:hypothetical protein
MRVLIGCEASGIVREEFKKRGHDAWSCDIKETEIPGQHIQDDLLLHLNDGWDLGIFHPECRYLCWSGERWLKTDPCRMEKRVQALEFFMACYNAKIPHLAVENSYSKYLIRLISRPTQSIHPYHFGDPFKKMTCLWLKNLPPLYPTNILPIGHRYPKAWMMGQKKNRSEERSKTYPGIAAAMAEQWGSLV